MDASLLIQAKIFLLSVLYGIFILCLYDGWKVLWHYKDGDNRAADTFYWSAVGIALFLFVEEKNQGNIRGYLFLGWFLGMGIYGFTLRRYPQRFFIWLHPLLKKIKKAVKMAIGRR
jgi:hypothetical protein